MLLVSISDKMITLIGRHSIRYCCWQWTWMRMCVSHLSLILAVEFNVNIMILDCFRNISSVTGRVYILVKLASYPELL